MNFSTLLLLIALPVLLVACAICAAAETALFSLSHGDRVRMRRQNPGMARLVSGLVERPRSLIISLLLANSAVIASYLAVGGILAKSIQIEWLSVAATLAVPFVLIVFGEVLPKSLAGVHPMRASMLLAIPVSLWDRLVSPLRLVMDEYFIAPLARLFRPAGAAEEHPLTVEELEELLLASQSGGAIDAREQRLLAEVVGLGTLRVRDVMTPRVDIRWIAAGATYQNVLAELRESARSRLPVSRGADGENVLGFLNTRAYLAAVERQGTGVSIANHVEPVTYVPERGRVDALLEHFRQTRGFAAIVVDEKGGVVGVVDIEDAVMPLVRATASASEIQAGVRKVSSDEWLVEGRINVRDWAEIAGAEFAVSSQVSTLAGFVQLRLGRLARVGDQIQLGSLRITVESLDGRAIETIRVRLVGGATP